MAVFAPVTDAELALARADRAFRQKLLTDNLDILLATLQKLRKAAASDKATADHIREGVQLAVRLAELIQHGASKAA